MCYFPGIEGASEELFSHYLASLGHSELDWTFPPAAADFCRADACILMFEAFSGSDARLVIELKLPGQVGLRRCKLDIDIVD